MIGLAHPMLAIELFATTGIETLHIIDTPMLAYVAARVRIPDVHQPEQAARRARDVRAVPAPLVGDWPIAQGRDVEQGGLVNGKGLVLRFIEE